MLGIEVTPIDELPGASRQLRQIMAKSKLSEFDLGALEDLMVKDLEYFGVKVEWADIGNAAGKYLEAAGKPGDFFRSTRYSDLSNLGHEWLHFEQHRLRGWREATDLESLLDEIQSYTWQVIHAEELGTLPWTTNAHRNQIEYFQREVDDHLGGK